MRDTSREGVHRTPHVARLKLCAEAANKGWGVKEAAEEAGVSSVALLYWLRRWGYTELHAQLRENSEILLAKKLRLSKERMQVRLEALLEGEKAGRSVKETAKMLHMKPNTLSKWRKKNAPDGAQDALDLFTDSVESGDW